MNRILNGLAAALLLSATTAAGAASGAGGQPGDPQQVTRTIEVVMHDNYFEPEQLSFAAGETVRLKVRNEGALVHEFNIGTERTHRAHADEMRDMMKSGAITARSVNEEQMAESGMTHDDPGSLLLEPGETSTLTWSFPDHGPVQIACNVPGHREAGMKAELEIAAR